MTDRRLPRYPVYIPSKGRADLGLTARMFAEDGVPFYLVVEPEETEAYAANVGSDHVLTLPFSNRGSVIPARNWIKDHATENGYKRHWQFDDNIGAIRRMYKGKRLYCRSGVALAVLEDFTDRYLNVGISGFNYTMFSTESETMTPFTVNCHVYSCSLISNEMPYRWRGTYNEDTDICLQVLAGGLCTILLNAFLVNKATTMQMRGGNTDVLYRGDGRLKMARALEKAWPGVVETKRRWQRPQHVVNSAWRKFDTPLIRNPDVEIPEGVDEYGMELVAVKEVKSPRLQKLLKESTRPLDI